MLKFLGKVSKKTKEKLITYSEPINPFEGYN